MKNWKDFDWTDEDGKPLPPQFQWAAIDCDGSAWAYDVDCEFRGRVTRRAFVI